MLIDQNQLLSMNSSNIKQIIGDKWKFNELISLNSNNFLILFSNIR
jgi:hypothetical protein